MTETEISILQDIYRLESTSFVRYVVEVSRPPVVDESDRKVLALYQDLYRDIDRNGRAVGEVLLDAGIALGGEVRWPLQYTNYNYLRPRYLLRPLREKLRVQFEQVEAKAAALMTSASAELKEILEAVLRRERSSVERVNKVAEETPEERPEPPELKGTSASRW